MDPNNLPIGHKDRPNPYNLPDPSDGHQFETVSQQSVEIRLSPLSWPEHADATQQMDLSKRWGDARAAYLDFKRFAEGVDADPRLSAEGKLQEKQKWARTILPTLQKTLDGFTNDASLDLQSALNRHIAEYMGKHAEAPKDPNDLQVCSEIRAMLRALPEAQRMAKIVDLASQGDRMVIQAVMNAPSYLSGVHPELLRAYQVELTRAALPNRMGPWQGRKDALLMTRRAIDGVIRHIGGETKLLPELRAHLKADPASEAA